MTLIQRRNNVGVSPVGMPQSLYFRLYFPTLSPGITELPDQQSFG